MPLINLVQERQLATRARDRQARTLFFAFATVSVVSLLGFGIQTLEAERLGSQISQLRSQMARLTPIQKQIADNKQEINALKPRLDTLKQAQSMTDIWDRVLTHLVTQTPSGTWLTAVRGNSQDPKHAISVGIIGKGKDQKSVADLMLRTQTEPDLGNVTLKFTELKQTAQDNSLEFEVDADLTATTPPPPPAKKDKDKDKDASGAKA